MNKQPNRGGLIAQAWSYVRQAWLVILLALLYGGALAGVQSTLGRRIEQNKRNETYSKIPGLVGIAEPLSEADQKTVRIQEQTVQGQQDAKPHRVYQAFFHDQLQGWVLPASGLGFADRIDLLIGLDAGLSTITGLYVLDQKETPGLGNNITSEELFLNQFAGKSAGEQLVVVKTEPVAGKNQIRALTGATISSESVAEIVNQAIQNLRQPIRQLPLAPTTPPTAPPHGHGS
jgi:electron transport complex protein RnfG